MNVGIANGAASTESSAASTWGAASGSKFVAMDENGAGDGVFDTEERAETGEGDSCAGWAVKIAGGAETAPGRGGIKFMRVDMGMPCGKEAILCAIDNGSGVRI